MYRASRLPVPRTVTPPLKCLYIVYFNRNKIMSSSTTQNPQWLFIADYIETCNCDYGCPSNFNGFPTYGSCHTLLSLHIRSGSYSDARLDGLDFIIAQSWPKAIHEGNGTTQLSITNKANEKQRQALINIYSGKQREMLLLLYLLRHSNIS